MLVFTQHIEENMDQKDKLKCVTIPHELKDKDIKAVFRKEDRDIFIIYENLNDEEFNKTMDSLLNKYESVLKRLADS